MPVDPRHLRRIPSGRRLARVLASVFAAMRGDAIAAVMLRREPDLGKYRPAIIRAALPILLHEYALGHEAARRDHRRRTIAEQVERQKAASGFTDKSRSMRSARTKAVGVPVALPGVQFDLLREGVPAAVQRLVLALAGTVTDTLRQDIRDAVSSGLQAGEALTSVANRVGEFFTPQRAYTIAATEASRSMHSAEAEAAQEAGAAGLEWMASSDACEEVCLPLDGKRVKFGEPFMVHATGRPEYRTVYHAPAHPRCACSVSPFWEDD